MDCKSTQSNLTAYDDRELEFSEAETIKHHLINCASCSSAHRSLQNVWSALDRLPAEEPDPFAMTRFLARMKPERRFFPALRLALAAAFTLVLGIGLFVNNRQGTNPAATGPNPASIAASRYPDFAGAAPVGDNTLFESVFSEKE